MTRRTRWLPELEHGVLEGATPPSTYDHGVGAQLTKLREQRDEARAEVARLRSRLVELEDVAQVEEARRREGAVLVRNEAVMPAAEGDPPLVNEERLYAALHRHGPRRGGRG
jgi:hypothetical protein